MTEYEDSDEEIGHYTEEEKFIEARKRSYLNAINDVSQGMEPIEALAKMWHTTIEWQDEPLEVVIKRIMGDEITPGAYHRRIWKVRQEYENRQRVKPKRTHTLPPSLPSKPLPFVTSELEEDFELEEEPPTELEEEIDEPTEEIEEEPEVEEPSEEEEFWLQRTTERQKEEKEEEEKETQTRRPSSRLKEFRKIKKQLQTEEENLEKLEKQKQEKKSISVTPRVIKRPKVTVSATIPELKETSEFKYRLWNFDGINFVPLKQGSEWIGSSDLEQAKDLASQHSSKLWPKDLVTKNFNLWEKDKETGRIIPFTYRHKDELLHLGHDKEEIAQKMIAAITKQFGAETFLLPRNQTTYQGQNLAYYLQF